MLETLMHNSTIYSDREKKSIRNLSLVVSLVLYCNIFKL